MMVAGSVVLRSFSLLGDEVTRLYDPAGRSDSGGSGPDLLRWPHTSGFILTSGGSPLSEEAAKAAHEIFSAVRDEAVHYFRRHHLPNRNGRVLRDKTRLLTFYNARLALHLIACAVKC